MRKRVLWLLVIVVVLAAGLSVWSHWYGVPEDFVNMEAEYKYGSIGSDHPRARAPIPYWIWKVLPELFPPSVAIGNGEWYRPKNDKKGYAAFGLVTEAIMDKPRAEDFFRWYAGKLYWNTATGHIEHCGHADFHYRRLYSCIVIFIRFITCRSGICAPLPGNHGVAATATKIIPLF